MSGEKIVEIDVNSDFSIIKFFEYVDVSTIEKARPTIKGKLPEESPVIVIDLNDTTFLDSHGIGFFVSLLKKAHSLNGQMFFMGAHDQPAAVLKMVGFNESLVQYCNNIDEVKKSLLNKKQS